MAKFVTLGDACFRLGLVAAFSRGSKTRDDVARMVLNVWLSSDDSGPWRLDDDSGELFAKLQRAMEAG